MQPEADHVAKRRNWDAKRQRQKDGRRAGSFIVLPLLVLGLFRAVAAINV
ncbi:hypothetical protein GCM10020370_29870 [Paenibacillus hodogayensis]